MLEKTMRMNALFDFYHSLLTDKQRNYLKLYYYDDYSLGEISELYEVSRQAVYDNIRRSEQMLEDYEAKLGLFHRYRIRQELYKTLKEIGDETDNRELLRISEELERAEE
ncbi:putative DNA-binding protein [Geomicrobium sp. JCM 19039]|uniref:putative DNA-binding protein n=1 Tax=Geomicrobium sp. JCM 19039 TaxID=1460636 RepID=UPI00045F38FD|nr:putative DNA-binding protein [Geomicrobium sp. JCM 19039]GAK10888.1 signal recognition particle associated protein [Geomicrobium sp. JCM 19039]